MPTEFEEKVYAATKLIPKGQITTYKNIAIAIGKPKACQAVGNALRKNPYAPIVPCHRVLPSTYRIGGFFGEVGCYSIMVQKKTSLLKKEGIIFDNDEENVIICDKEYRKKITHTF
jgi:methylated-DNA-[protein]-cysteine S-methyltransferase